MKIIMLINLCVLLLVVGCAKEVKKDGRPEWIDTPEPNFVGQCTTHAESVIAQERCAYEKALATITILKSDSVDTNVSATVVDKWRDESADITYVLIKKN